MKNFLKTPVEGKRGNQGYIPSWTQTCGTNPSINELLILLERWGFNIDWLNNPAIQEYAKAGFRFYEFLTKDNTSNDKSEEEFYFRDGDPDVEYWKARFEAVFRLNNTGAYLDQTYAPFGEVCPLPYYYSIGSVLRMDGGPVGNAFNWDNGAGGGAGYWYDVEPGEIIYNVTRGTFATIATWSLFNCTVTNAADIALWQNNDDMKVYSTKLDGKFKIEQGFTAVLDFNAYRDVFIHGSNSGDNLKFQICGRSWVIRGKKGPAQGTFNLFQDGVFLAVVDCTAGGAVYDQALYTFIPPTTITDNEEYVRKRHIIEIKPNGDGDIDIERIWVRNSRFSLTYHCASPQMYAPSLIPVAVALNDDDMFKTVMRATKNLINMNQLQGQSSDNLPWSSYLHYANKYTFKYSGVGSWEATNHSSNPTYQVFAGQPTNTASGFVGFALSMAYLGGKEYLSSAEKTILEDAILETCAFLKEGKYSFNVYTTNAALFHGLTFIAGHLINEERGTWVAQTAVLDGALNNVDRDFGVVDASNLGRGDILKVEDEYMAIDNIVGNTITAYRGIWGSGAVAHLSGTVATTQDYNTFAKILLYNMENGNVGGGDPFLRYVQNTGDDNTNLMYGEELPTETTLNNGGNLLAADTSVIVTSLEDIGITEDQVTVIDDSGGTPMTGLDVDSILWQVGNTIRYTFLGAPDLSTVAVGDRWVGTSAGIASNDGNFDITAIDDIAKHIDVTNPARANNADDEAPGSPCEGEVRGDLAFDMEIEKADSTWEVVRINHVNIGAETITDMSRSQDGSTAQAVLADGALVKRAMDWVYNRMIGSQFGMYYYFAKELGWTPTEIASCLTYAKGTYSFARQRVNFTTGTYDSIGGSRLPNGGANFATLAGLLNILKAMGEGWQGKDQGKLFDKFQVQELEEYHYLADAVRGASDDYNRELGNTILMLNISAPIVIALRENAGA